MNEPTDEQIREWMVDHEVESDGVHWIDRLYYIAIGVCLGAILAFTIAAVSR